MLDGQYCDSAVSGHSSRRRRRKVGRERKREGGERGGRKGEGDGMKWEGSEARKTTPIMVGLTAELVVGIG